MSAKKDLKGFLKSIKSKISQVKESFDQIDDWVIENLFKESIAQALEWMYEGPDVVYFKVCAQFGIHLEFNNTITRQKKLLKWYQNPPHNNETVKAFIIDMAPNKVCIFSANSFNMGVSLFFERGTVWNGKAFKKKIDRLLKSFK